MARTRVLQELSRSLQLHLERGLRPDERTGDEPGVSLYLVHPQELDRAPELPVGALYLWDVQPASHLRSRASALGSEPGEHGPRETLRGPPIWLLCRYAIAFRDRRAEGEHDLIGTAVRHLHDAPSLDLDDLPSLREDSAITSGIDRLPLLLESRAELWRVLGLPRHRLVLGIEVTVPVPSLRDAPAVRVHERRVELDMDATLAGRAGERPAPARGDGGVRPGPADHRGRPGGGPS